MNRYRVIFVDCQDDVVVECTKVVVKQDGSRVFWSSSGPRPAREDVDWEGEIVAVYPSSVSVELIGRVDQ